MNIKLLIRGATKIKKLTDCRFLFSVNKSSATTSNISDNEEVPFLSFVKSITGGGPAATPKISRFKTLTTTIITPN